MLGKKFFVVILIVLYGAWFLLKNIHELNSIACITLPPSPVNIIENGSSDDIYFRGYVYRGVRAGDVIFRQIGINWGSRKDRIVNRIIAHGIPGFYEHASIYIGRGKVYNIGPDDPRNTIVESNLGRIIEDCPADHIHIVRLTNDRSVVARMIDFIRLHKKLSNEGSVQFIANERKIKKMRLDPPIKIGGSVFEYYYNGFNCVNGLIKAYDYAGLDIERTIESRRSVASRLAGFVYFIYPSEENLCRMIDNFFYTGYQIKLLSLGEVAKEKI